MSNPILPPYVWPGIAVTNITPFTIRDGITYVEKLEALRDHYNKLVDYVNLAVPGMGEKFEEEVNKLFDQVNEALTAQNIDVVNQLAANLAAVDAAIASIVDNSLEANDDVVSALILNLNSDTSNSLDARYALASVVSALAAEVGSLNVDEINDELNGRLSVTSLNDSYAGKSIETIINIGRLTDANLNTKVDTRANSVLDANLDPDVAALIVSDSQIKTALDGRYKSSSVFIGQQIKRFATQASMLSTTASNYDLAVVDNIPGVNFRYQLDTWMMEGVAIFGDSIARDAAISTPNVTMRSKIATEPFDRIWNGTKWTPYGGKVLLSNTTINTPTLVLANAFSDDFNEYELIIDCISSNVSTDVGLLLRASGANINTNYSSRYIQGVASSTTTVVFNTYFNIGTVSTAGGAIRVEITNPKINRPTRVFSKSIDSDGAIRYSSGYHSLATSYSDCFLQFNLSASVSGTVKIYGISQ